MSFAHQSRVPDMSWIPECTDCGDVADDELLSEPPRSTNKIANQFLAAAIVATIQHGSPLPGVPVGLASPGSGASGGLVVDLSGTRAFVLTTTPGLEGADLNLSVFGVEPTKCIHLRARVIDSWELAACVNVLCVEVTPLSRLGFRAFDRLVMYVGEVASVGYTAD